MNTESPVNPMVCSKLPLFLLVNVYLLTYISRLAYASKVFELSLEYLESATRAQNLENPEEQDPFVAGLKGSCLYYSAMSKSADAAEEVKV